MPSVRLLVLMALGAGTLSWLGGCAVPAREADPTISPWRVQPEFFEALNVRVVQVGEARVPTIALRRALATVQRHLGIGMTLTFADDQAAPADAWARFAWPVDETRLGPEDGAGVRLLSTPEAGVLGVVRSRNQDGLESPIRAIVERGTILIAILPGPEGGAGVTGYATGVMRPGDGGPEPSLGMVVVFQSAIERRSGFFVDRERLWEWTLTHEMGHVLGVPAGASHRWSVPGLGIHCTRPECVMYTGLDWRVVVSGILHGWPLDYCVCCAAELRRAREEQAVGRGHPDSIAGTKPM